MSESNLSPMHDTEMTTPTGGAGASEKGFSGGLQVSTTGMDLRHVFAGATQKTMSSLSAEPKREAGLHGPATGPGLLSNHVVTSMYTTLNFLPKFLVKSFSRVANCYFLMICILQTFPAVSITHGKPTTVVPLTFILFVAACKEINEDLARHRADDEENNTQTRVIASGGVYNETPKETKWSDVKVGDVIEVRNREPIPCDIILLETSHPEGQCQIMTANLDGETNLKTMVANADMMVADRSNMGGYAGEIVCELPNNRLLNFEGTYTRPDGEKVSLGPKNVLLRGVVLRQTDWVRGIAVYTGKETKIQMNAAEPPNKVSSVMKMSNDLTKIMFLVDICFCFMAAVVNATILSTDEAKNSCYLWGNCEYMTEDYASNKMPSGSDSVLIFFTHILIFTNFIPISLLVTIDMVKLGQAKMLEFDLEMYHEIKDHAGDVAEIPMSVKRSDLNEELGQVRHIFSDKTGTLTCNMMDFRKCSIAGKSYGLGTTAIGLSFLKRNNMQIPVVPPKPADDPDTPHVNFIDPEFSKIMKDPSHPEYRAACDFFLSLALNHDVLPEANKAGEVVYSASSPDEAALVYAAKHFGFFFKRTETGGKLVVGKRGAGGQETDEVYEVLNFLEFNSDRKRSSVILREPGTGKIVLYCKGADNVMKKRLAAKQRPDDLMKKTEEHLNQFVDDGLRTLLVGKTYIDESFYTSWKKKFTDAENSLENRDEKRMAVMELIEKDLQLMGVTAIEDKLQDGVGDALTSFRGANIKVWMLTGDKVDTAINIGYSCSLLDTGMTLLRACGEDGEMEVDHDKIPTDAAITRKISELLAQAREGDNEKALVVDTSALSAIMQYRKEKDLNEVCKLCKSVICARVTPRQKASIVDMVRFADPGVVTLSIGDGANDVPMIQTAHIGVGIHGLEGRQAVNNSDYAIGQFRFLRKLLLVHGRWNYRRTCKVCLYMFYKNVCYVVPQFLFGLYCMMSGQPIYHDFIYQMYNTMYTATPIVIYGILDRDVTKEVALANPWLYFDGQANQFMSRKIFMKWVGEGIAHASTCFWVPVFCYKYGIFDAQGLNLDLFTGIGTFTNMLAVVVASGRLYCETGYFNYPHPYIARGSCASQFFEGMVSWTGSGCTWQLISFALWWAMLKMISDFGVDGVMGTYFFEVGGSFPVLAQDLGLYMVMIWGMVFVFAWSFSLILAQDLFGTQLRANVANRMEAEKARIQRDNGGGAKVNGMLTDEDDEDFAKV
mmetsp:Transcript_15420/g.30739  ORF Transcript_15420/g.30739 Transcript_15420/m.30739 type:complete len:1231 (+) Transcript_15420:239-3931(+)|eukprot:CAMPEP_0182455146 /NCGR_PEP_ID=MMETSP1319-20130603/1446_1 /TAXON_ID=172717 /ORGANISM="Bolidomonas pacifica, Strain RCC208" /LENGTH=1230 /DNA_ID=CAMNT_0024653183 /DNA_START=238 /DNA_END=3930 /DNA_ORIENTATION=+